MASCSAAAAAVVGEAAASSCGAGSSRAVVTLSIGERPFTRITRPLLELFAAKVGASLHVVDSVTHPSLASHHARLKRTTRFLKLPLLSYYLERYEHVLYLDDDIVLSPATADLFALTPCGMLGAVVERHKPQAWHAMHWRVACELYDVERCSPKQWMLFNSGVMVLSRAAHLPALRTWQREPRLECRVLCDQLYFNALSRRGTGLCLHDLGAAFNFVGSEVRRALVAPTPAAARAPEQPSAAARRAALRAACVLHLTRKVPKLYTADWVARRALGGQRDVLQCSVNASWPRGRWRRSLLARLPPSTTIKYDIGHVMCDLQPQGCTLLPWVSLPHPGVPSYST